MGLAIGERFGSYPRATPRGRLDGTELYYMTGYDHGTLMAVPVGTNGDALTLGNAEALFPVDMAIVPHSTLAPNFHTYAVTRDGQRFVLPLPVSTLRSGTAPPPSRSC
jgi:hypothetical protein